MKKETVTVEIPEPHVTHDIESGHEVVEEIKVKYQEIPKTEKTSDSKTSFSIVWTILWIYLFLILIASITTGGGFQSFSGPGQTDSNPSPATSY